MGNYNPNAGRHAPTDENRPDWRPQDQAPVATQRHRGNEDDHDYGSWRDRNQDRPVNERDPGRWDGSRGSELGSSDDSWRATERSDMMRGSGSREDRDFGGATRGRTEDRGYHPERHGAHGRGFEAERGRAWSAYDGPQRPAMDRNDMRGRGRGEPAWGNQMGGHDQRMGYQGGHGSDDERMGYQGGNRPDFERRAYQGYGGSQDDPQRVDGFGPHQHRGTGPHRGKGPAGYQRSDERIRELVSEALADDDQIDASHIHVAVKDGEVTLTGIVDDRRTRREAEDCVSAVSGVRDVQIQLRVKDDRQAQGTHASSQLGAERSSAGTGNAMTPPGAAKHDVETAQDKKPRA